MTTTTPEAHIARLNKILETVAAKLDEVLAEQRAIHKREAALTEAMGKLGTIVSRHEFDIGDLARKIQPGAGPPPVTH